MADRIKGITIEPDGFSVFHELKHDILSNEIVLTRNKYNCY